MFENLSEKLQPELSEIYRYLHTIPELSFCEYKTSEYIGNKLTEYGIEFNVLLGTGIYADIKGNNSGKTVLLRADIDALPIDEKSGVDFKSKHKGCMHACGHDAHTSCLLGAAKLLNAIRDRFNGTVRIVFQPGEEGDGGALPMINNGILNGVSAAFALHVEPLEEAGNIQVKYGSIMASPDEFEITITGKGGHGAYPHTCIDPILTAAMIVNAYQTVVSRNIDPMVPAAVSVCSIKAGNCPNVIPDSAYITGTARSLDNETREKLEYTLEKIAKNTSESMGADCEFNFKKLFPPLINDKKITDITVNAARKLGIGVVWLERASMAGDDFAYFSQNVPGTYFKLGVGNKKRGIIHPIHSPEFRIEESALHIGSAVLAKSALDYLAL
ncbi:MAG: amidohydrolase [Oscillospiraceae bacterium]|nr:amidohydrolase [Oscillospiraceae bacterium]